MVHRLSKVTCVECIKKLLSYLLHLKGGLERQYTFTLSLKENCILFNVSECFTCDRSMNWLWNRYVHLKKNA